MYLMCVFVYFRCVRGVTGIQSAPSNCPSRGFPRLSWSVSLATTLLETFLKKMFFSAIIMMILNRLHQIWIVSQWHGGRSVKARCTYPSHSLTWTLGLTDPSTVVRTNKLFFLSFFRFYPSIWVTESIFVFLRWNIKCAGEVKDTQACEGYILKRKKRSHELVEVIILTFWHH